ncbi:MAG TPA: DUF6152 family protein [Bryobacteraceae bacterium]|nr:DUF6152 family protein [Bryobacteraceae bacterium]
MFYRSLASLVILAGGLPALAHHSFSEEFDTSKPVTLEGVVTRLDWENPHVHYFVDVVGPDGTVVNWSCETGGPGRLARKGWTHDSLKVGDKIVVRGFLAKDGSHAADGREVKLADGRKIGTDPGH